MIFKIFSHVTYVAHVTYVVQIISSKWKLK
jgi:hypothetical protein